MHPNKEGGMVRWEGVWGTFLTVHILYPVKLKLRWEWHWEES